jgi:hypothetical protein
VNVLRLLLVFLSLLGPPVSSAAGAQVSSDEESAHDVEDAAIELRALGLQPPPPSPRPDVATVADPLRPRLGVRARGARVARGRRCSRRIARRLLFGGDDGDDDPDSMS